MANATIQMSKDARADKLTALPGNSVADPALGTLGNINLGSGSPSVRAAAVELPSALTPNEVAAIIAVGQASGLPALGPVPTADLDRVLAPFGSLPAGDVARYLEQLTPQSLQYSRDIAFENSTMLVQRMNAFDANLRSGWGGLDVSGLTLTNPAFNSAMGRSLGSFFAQDDGFHGAAPNGVNYYPVSDVAMESAATSPMPSATGGGYDAKEMSDVGSSPWQPAPAAMGPPVSVFLAGDAVLAQLNQDSGASNAPSTEAKYLSAGATGGVAFRVTSNLSAGVLFDYAHTDAHTDGSGSKMRVDSYSPGFFGTYFDHGFYVNGLFAWGFNSYGNERQIGDLHEVASSHPGGDQYTASADFGYDFHPDKHWVLGPQGGVTYTHLNVDDFTEEGAPGADLHVDSTNAESLRSRLGGHAIYTAMAGDVIFQPNLSVLWQHEAMAGSAQTITSNFSDFASNPFTIQTIAPGRDSALVTLGVDVTLTNSMALYFDYLADVGSSTYYAQSIVGGFKAHF
jgi:uncharacterized protein YhjY with autotransporter beta-barrel domain